MNLAKPLQFVQLNQSSNHQLSCHHCPSSTKAKKSYKNQYYQLLKLSISGREKHPIGVGAKRPGKHWVFPGLNTVIAPKFF